MAGSVAVSWASRTADEGKHHGRMLLLPPLLLLLTASEAWQLQRLLGHDEHCASIARRVLDPDLCFIGRSQSCRVDDWRRDLGASLATGGVAENVGRV